MSSNKKLFLIALFLALAISIPFTISQFTTKEQETRSRAAGGSATLALTPNSSSGSPIQKQIGDTISLDIMVDPGDHLVSFVKLQLNYDPTKLELSGTNPLTVNNATFPVLVEGPIISSGKIAQSVSVGSDPTKVIQTTAKVGTINFKAIGSTGNTPTTVTFTTVSQLLSTGGQDNANQNVLSSTTPANIAIGGNTQTSPTPGLTSNPTPTSTDKKTKISFNLLLHGIGAAGDNPNPLGNSLSNKAPLSPTRDLEVWVYDTSNKLVASESGSINYDATTGKFLGSVDLGSNFAKGSYNVKIKTDRYLRRLIPGVQNINNAQNNSLPQTELVAGDVNSDNVLNVLDYNAFLDCGYGALEPLPLGDPNSLSESTACKAHTPVTNVDLDDNGIINSPDYNLFLRELSVQNGD